MEHLACVRDSSTDEIVNGYGLCKVLAAHPYDDAVVPLHAEARQNGQTTAERETPLRLTPVTVLVIEGRNGVAEGLAGGFEPLALCFKNVEQQLGSIHNLGAIYLVNPVNLLQVLRDAEGELARVVLRGVVLVERFPE